MFYNVEELGSISEMKKFIYYIGLSLGLISGLNSMVLAQETNASNHGAFYHYYNQQSLQHILKKIAKEDGKQIVFEKTLSVKLLSTRITGNFKVSNNQELLDELAKEYGFNWYINLNTIYITGESYISKEINVNGTQLNSVRGALTSEGVLNPKFGYSEIPEDNQIVVTGPASYVTSIAKHIKKINQSKGNEQFAIFHLKYAKVEDEELSFNNQPIIIPGVATILRYLFTGNIEVNNNPILNQIAAPLKKQFNSLVESRNTNAVSYTNNTPLIEADPRLNTIIIRDRTNSMALYSHLINELDVPAPLIQINVVEIKLNDDKLDEEDIGYLGLSDKGITGGVSTNSISNRGDLSIANSLNKIAPGNLIITNYKDFVSSLVFLEQNAFAKTTNKPSLVTIDNLPAIMSDTKTLYITLPTSNVTVYSSNSDNQGSVTQAQVNTALSITPHVIPLSNQKYNIELSIILQNGDITNPNSAPITDQNTINSQAVIREGQSLLLAGYTQNIMETYKSQIPVLGSIPLLGWFFRSSTAKDTKETNLYLITPQIIWNTYTQGEIQNNFESQYLNSKKL